ncbi:MAG: glycerophosphodiester phosphodiesterase [Bacillota bacterium]
MLVIGHRGAGAYSPHNSRQSFAQAIAMGAQMIETDLRVTLDNIPVIHHDPDTLWGPIDQLKWDELRKYPLENGEHLLSLEEMLQLFGQKVRFNLEIKPISVAGIDPIFFIINRYALPQPLISSFAHNIIKYLPRLENYETALLVEESLPIENLLATLEQLKVSCLNLYYPLLDKDLAATIHHNNYKVIVWSDFFSEIWNPVEMYRKAHGLKCEGYITGKPNLLTNFLKFS